MPAHVRPDTRKNRVEPEDSPDHDGSRSVMTPGRSVGSRGHPQAKPGRRTETQSPMVHDQVRHTLGLTASQPPDLRPKQAAKCKVRAKTSGKQQPLSRPTHNFPSHELIALREANGHDWGHTLKEKAMGRIRVHLIPRLENATVSECPECEHQSLVTFRVAMLGESGVSEGSEITTCPECSEGEDEDDDE